MATRHRNIRTRKTTDEDEGSDKDEAGDVCRDKLKDVQLLQKHRKRTGGLRAEALATGNGQRLGASEADEPTELMGAYVKAAPLEGISTNEDDPHMKQYIDAEVVKRLGKSADASNEDEGPEARRRKLELELYAVPEEYKSQMQQEVIIPGLITGISEVALPLDQRLKNIEATEAIKRSLLSKEDDAKPVVKEDKMDARRYMFVSSFGKNTNKRPLTDDDIEKVPKFVRDPNKRQHRRR